MGTMAKRNRWFVLEDNEEMLTELKELGKELGSEPITARSIEAAVEVTNEHSDKICLAFIDMMVPKSEADLLKLDQLMQDRAEWSAGEPGVCRRIREIDAEIPPLIDLHGGLNFLRGISEEKIKHWKVYLFSSRTPTAIERNHKGLSHLHIVKWLAKPVDDDLLFELIREHIKQ